jgi:hypothetical protein
MRMPGDVVFSIGGFLMAWDFLMKLRKPRGEVHEPRASAAAVAAE